MRTIVFILLILIAAIVILPCVVFGQTSVRLDVIVTKIPVSEREKVTCSNQTIRLFYSRKGFGFKTDDDRLQLGKILVDSVADHIVRPEVITGQRYLIQYVEDKDGLSWMIVPDMNKVVSKQKLYSFMISSDRYCPTFKDSTNVITQH